MLLGLSMNTRLSPLFNDMSYYHVNNDTFPIKGDSAVMHYLANISENQQTSPL
jgi:hypothetical protein